MHRFKGGAVVTSPEGEAEFTGENRLCSVSTRFDGDCDSLPERRRGGVYGGFGAENERRRYDWLAVYGFILWLRW